MPVLIVAALAVAAMCLLAAAFFSEGRARWFLTAGGLVAVFAILAALLDFHSLAALDSRVDAWLGITRSHTRAQRLWGYLGDPAYILIALIGCGTLLSLWGQSALPGVLLGGGFTVGVVLEQMFKALIGRSATSGPLLDFPHSFPSGHVTATAVLLGMIAVCLGIGRSSAAQTTLAILAVQGVVFVALLAVYIRAHTVSDTLGGMVLGGVIVALGAAILNGTRTARRLTRRRERRRRN